MGGRAVHNVEQEPNQNQEEENQSDTVKISSTSFISKFSVITETLKHHQIKLE